MTKTLLPGLRPVRLSLGFAVMTSKMKREPDRATATSARDLMHYLTRRSHCKQASDQPHARPGRCGASCAQNPHSIA